jgi:acetolactate synthase-1/2/3 large subunit
VGPRRPPQGRPALIDLDAPASLAPLLAEAELRLRLRPAGGDRWVVPDDAVVAAIAAAERPIVLAGPGVVLDGAVPGLHALAAAGSLGVLNTWGAKGVFDWRSRHHLATAGLQALDFERGGLGDADLIVATGVDEREARAPWRLAPVVEVPPWSLGPLAEQLVRPRSEVAVPPLRADLGRITQEGWAATDGPLPPTKATQRYGLALGGGGLVAGDPGLAGYWVARTMGTTSIGGALIAADRDAAGFGVACALVARLLQPERHVLAVADELDDVHRELLELAARLGVPLGVEVWRPDGPPLDAEAHEAQVARLVGEGGVAELGTDPAQLERMLEAAGPIVAWT